MLVASTYGPRLRAPRGRRHHRARRGAATGLKKTAVARTAPCHPGAGQNVHLCIADSGSSGRCRSCPTPRTEEVRPPECTLPHRLEMSQNIGSLALAFETLAKFKHCKRSAGQDCCLWRLVHPRFHSMNLYDIERGPARAATSVQHRGFLRSACTHIARGCHRCPPDLRPSKRRLRGDREEVGGNDSGRASVRADSFVLRCGAAGIRGVHPSQREEDPGRHRPPRSCSLPGRNGEFRFVREGIWPGSLPGGALPRHPAARAVIVVIIRHTAAQRFEPMAMPSVLLSRQENKATLECGSKAVLGMIKIEQ